MSQFCRKRNNKSEHTFVNQKNNMCLLVVSDISKKRNNLHGGDVRWVVLGLQLPIDIISTNKGLYDDSSTLSGNGLGPGCWQP